MCLQLISIALSLFICLLCIFDVLLEFYIISLCDVLSVVVV